MDKRKSVFVDDCVSRAREAMEDVASLIVLAEQFMSDGGMVVIADPVGVWWGLRHAGAGQGFPVGVLGGEHGEAPLSDLEGAVIAEMACHLGWPVVLDLSGLSKGGMRRFMTDFAEKLYHLKAKDRTPMHLILDEADAFAPQRTAR